MVSLFKFVTELKNIMSKLMNRYGMRKWMKRIVLNKGNKYFPIGLNIGTDKGDLWVNNHWKPIGKLEAALN